MSGNRPVRIEFGLPLYADVQFSVSSRSATQTLADGSIWHFAYTLSGSKVTETDVTDPNGDLQKVTFNSSGYWLTQKMAFGTAIEQDYAAVLGGSTPPANCAGNTPSNSPTNYLIGETDALGRLSCWTYDPNGNVLTSTKLAGTVNAVTTTYTYGPFEQLTQVADPLGHTTSIGRDSLGRPTSITDGLGNISPVVANLNGTIASTSDPLGHTTSFTYDHADLTSVTDPLSRITTRFTDTIGRAVQVADPMADIWQWAYDPIWGVNLSTDPNGDVTTKNYNTDGRVSSLVDPRSTVGAPIQTQYAYDSMDRLITRTDPLLHSATINSYDGNGNVLTATDRKGQNVTYAYDALNRIASATFADGHVVSYTWDGGNRLTIVQDTVGGVSNTITRTYDGLDRLTEEQVVQASSIIGTVDYTYDAASRRATMTVSGQSPVTYTWDNANRLTQIVQGTSTVGIGYDIASRRTSLTLPNGIVATYTYDAASELTGISYDNGGVNVGTLTYAYDSAGRIMSRGGSLFQSVLPSAVASTSYNADNRLTQWGSASPAYDLNGNLTNDGTNTFTWDARNRLTAITGVASFVYDGSNRRQSATQAGVTIASFYDGFNPVQEQLGGAVFANLLTSPDVDERFARAEGAATSIYLTDLLCSTMALTDHVGAIQTSYGYDAYGAATTTGTANDSPYQFTGRPNAGNGLNYFRARYYNSFWGRFISEDPSGLRGGYNLYAYAGDSPVNLTDVFGLDPVGLAIGQTIGGWAGGAIGGIAGEGLEPIGGGVPGEIGGSYAGRYLGALAGDAIGNIILNMGTGDRQRGCWPGDTGSAEWGRKNGVGSREGRGRFHGIKQGDQGGAEDEYSVNPDTGDVFDPSGDYVGNLGDVKSK